MTEDQPGACGAGPRPVGPGPTVSGASLTLQEPCHQAIPWPAAAGRHPASGRRGAAALSFLGKCCPSGAETHCLSRPHGLTHPSELLSHSGS